MDQKNCPNCKIELPSGAAFCPICGQSLVAANEEPGTAEHIASKQEEKHTCPRCKTLYPPPLPAFCRACGSPMTFQPSSQEKQVRQTTSTTIADPVKTSVPIEKRKHVAVPPPPSPRYEKGEIAKPGLTRERGKRVRTILLLGLSLVIGSAVLIVLIGVVWQWWNAREQANTATVSVEACNPVKPGEDFVASNPRGLTGELDQNTYFRGGEEYTIASGGNLVVPQGVTLIIEPGARVKFGQGSKMIVRGTLLACGRTGRRIMFSADTTSGRPGFWEGIEFHAAHPDSVIGHATFEFAGKDSQAPIWLEDTDLHIENVKFESNQWFALSINPDSYPRIRPPFLVENGPQGWEVRAGILNKNRSWSGEHGFVIRGVVEVDEKATLTIRPGTWIKFQPESALNLYGKLSAVGAEQNRIVFTSANDFSDNRNSSGPAPEPASGDWIGIRFVGRKAQSQLSSVDIRYAGAESNNRGCVWMSDAHPLLKDVAINDCAAFSISMDILSQPGIDRIILGETDIGKQWELRGSKLEGVNRRVITRLWTANGTELILPIITGWIEIGEQATLQIDEGVKLLFKGNQTSGLRVYGQINLNGSQKESITLTSWRDPELVRAGGAQPGDWGGVHLNNSKSGGAVFNHVAIRYGGAGGNGCVSMQKASPTLTHLSVSDCSSYPISTDAVSRPVIDGLSLGNNALSNQWEIRESSLDGRAEWDWIPIISAEGVPVTRHITGHIKVSNDATLTLKPGLLLKFAGGKGLLVQGTLVAEGTAELPIVITSWRDPEGGGVEAGAQPGDWVGVALEGSQSVKRMSFVEIRYAGYSDRGIGCLNLKESNPIINNLKIAYCSFYPIVSDLASDPRVSGLSLVNNKPDNDWAINESTLKKGVQRTWKILISADDNTSINRVAIGWLTIDPGARLEIKEGVVVKFHERIGLINKGSFIVEGNAGAPVLFTSWRDPEKSDLGGVQAGDWIGLVLDNIQGETRLNYVEIKYAGGERKPRGAIVAISSSPRFDHLSITDSAWYPISVDVKSSPQMDSLALVRNSPVDAVEIRGSVLDLMGETVWYPWVDSNNQPVVRVINEKIVIGKDASLRLEPGAILKFGKNAGMDIHGTLVAKQIVFTSLYDEQHHFGTSGSITDEPVWSGLSFYGRKLSRLEDVIIRYALVGIWLDDASPIITNALLENSGTAAISSDFVSNPQIINPTISGNTINGMLIRGTSLPEGVTHWKILGSEANQVVRVIENSLLIGPNARLIVDPGVVVKFGQQAGLVVEGQLFVGKMDDLRVNFTSLADDSLGGNTDNLWAQPNRGSWLGVAVNPNKTDARLSLFGVNIRFAVVGLFLTNMFNWDFEDVIISDSQMFGISCDATSLYLPEDARILLQNNGIETSGCPTLDREEDS